MVEHILKTHAEAWDACAEGRKRFEVRNNDRLFQTGDTVVLRKMDSDRLHYARGSGQFGTFDLKYKIGWILQGGRYGVEPGYCVFQLEDCAS